MRALLLAGGLFMSAVAIVACSPPPPAACSAASCAGCCDASGACQTGDQDTACGASASMCAACGAGFSCQLKSCVRSAAGGGGGGTGGGATGGGGGGGSTGGGTGGGATGGGAGGGATGGGAGGGATGGGAGGGATGGSGGGAPVSCQSMTPPTIAITFPVTCPAPTPCGGNPAGTFFYSAACVPQSEFDALVTRIENAGCGPGSVRLNGFDGGLAGSATFSGGTNICRTVRGGVTVSATVTGVCANPTACGFLSSGIAQGGYMGTCAVNAGACDCLVTRAININNGGIFYTVGATTLNITSNQQTFETCLTSTTFSTREVDAGMAEHEPGVATLTRQ